MGIDYQRDIYDEEVKGKLTPDISRVNESSPGNDMYLFQYLALQLLTDRDVKAKVQRL